MQSITVPSVLSPKPHTLPTTATCTLSLAGPRFILVAKPTGSRSSTVCHHDRCWNRPSFCWKVHLIVSLLPLSLSWLEWILQSTIQKCSYRIVNLNLFKGLIHIGYGERDHTVIPNSWCSHAWFSVACLKSSIEGI